MPFSLERKFAAGFATTVGFILVIGGLAWWSAARFSGTFRWVDHTHQVLYELEAGLTNMLNMQTSLPVTARVGTTVRLAVLRPTVVLIATVP